MSGFSTEWLRLREPHDAAARAAQLADYLPRAAHAERSIVDLGAGTGANLRYLAPLLGGTQDWLLVDHDPALLAAAPGEIAAWAPTIGARSASGDGAAIVTAAGFRCRVRVRASNLADELDALPIPEGALVTASALLDLVSPEWLHALATRCRAASANALFALTYDGRMSTSPADPDDELVRELVNEHQRTDKGLGLALGPGAVQAAVRVFKLCGYEVKTLQSDWQIPAGARALQRALITGWHDAGCAIAPKRAAALARWRRRRLEHVERGAATLRVGHVDFAARLAR